MLYNVWMDDGMKKNPHKIGINSSQHSAQQCSGFVFKV